MFWADPSVLYVSIHGEDEFPYYTGAASETGPAAGPGLVGSQSQVQITNLNLPLPTGSTFEAYTAKLETAIQAVEGFAPDYLLVSLGFDTFVGDPLGSFKIQTGDYSVMAAMVRGRLGMPSVIVLEGGYVVERLGENLLSFLEGWEGAEGV